MLYLPDASRSIRLFICLMVCLAVAFGQFESATVLGSITDAAQAMIAGAVVTLENTQTGVVNKIVTDENGNYQFFNVRAGSYRLRVEKQGFAAAVANEFTVTVGARQRVA